MAMKMNKAGDSSPAHVLKLLDRVGVEFGTAFFDINSRKVMREKLRELPALLDVMDDRDTKMQELPEVKIPALKQELKKNDELLKKNFEKPDEQIQVGLYQKGLPPGSPMFKVLLAKSELDLEDAEIKVKTKCFVINPTFQFQNDKRWVEIQTEYHKQNIKGLETNIKEINKQVKDVKKDITVQTERMKARRIQIIEELEKLKVDVSEFTGEIPDYIG